MFGDYSKDLLRNGIIELKAGNRETARRYIDRALYMSGDHDVMAEAWYWLSQTTDDAGDKRRALENCLANDLQHAPARRALAVLDGRLKPEEIIDPNAPLPVPGAEEAESGRFMCAKCGGRMVYAPDGRSLVCEYCRRQQSVSLEEARAKDHDFIVAMATSRGHGKPVREQGLHCNGCGAAFIFPTAGLSLTCAYCNSPLVVSVEQSKELISPDGILPHAFDQRHAGDVLTDWIESLKLEPEKPVPEPRGLYLPIWSFVLGGGIDYTAETTGEDDSRGGAREKIQVRDRYPVMLDVAVAASRRPSAPFVRLIPSFDLKAMQPYDARYLAAWPAELYDVSMADASLEARSQAYTRLKHDLPGLLAPLRVMKTSSANLTIGTFRLDLLPVWMAELAAEGRVGIVLINGQNGVVCGDMLKRASKAKGGMRVWLGDLLNG